MDTSLLDPTAEGVRRCLVRYEDDRGKAGRAGAPWKDGRRLTSGDAGADEAGERWEGGV